MKPFEVIGTIRDRKFSAGEQVRILFAQDFMQDKQVRVTVELFKQKRTSALNRFWWSFHIDPVKEMLEDASGERYTKEEVANFWKITLGYYREVGTEKLALKSRRFGNARMLEMIERSVAKAAELGLALPLYCEHLG